MSITSLALDAFMLGKVVVTGPYSQFTRITDHVLSIIRSENKYDSELELVMNEYEEWEQSLKTRHYRNTLKRMKLSLI